MPRPTLPTTAPARAAAGGGQGGPSLMTSVVIHGAALATLALAFEVPARRSGTTERVVEAHLEPREELTTARDEAPALHQVEAPVIEEPVLEPLEVPEAPAPRAPSSGASALDSMLLTAAPGSGFVSMDPLGAPTLPAPARAPRPILRPRSLPTSARPGAEAADGAPSTPPALLPPTADTSPSPIPGLCPPPAYPPAAQRRRLSGTVLLTIEVAASGLVTSVKVERSSGHEMLDQAAERAVRSWRFRPATYRGKPTAATVNKPIEFSLPAGG